jgi:uncharacterized protein (UPF0548 family)
VRVAGGRPRLPRRGALPSSSLSGGCHGGGANTSQGRRRSVEVPPRQSAATGRTAGTVAMVWIMLARPRDGALADLGARLEGRAFTYDEVGATAKSPLPVGYRHDRLSVEIGDDPQVWARAQDALRTWQGHRHAKATITPADAALDAGLTVVVTVRVGPLFVVAPSRIVYTTLEADRFGFAYGTLPGHPERGEEAFHVVRAAGGAVSVEITAFSRPAALAARVGSPVARAIQQRITRRYLEGIRAHAASTH